MKTKHIIIYSVLLALLISVFAFCAINADAEVYFDFCGENAIWEYDSSTGTLCIYGDHEFFDYGYPDFPWSPYRNEITTVYIEHGITEIPAWAFANMPVLSEVVIPETVIEIGEYAFSDCDSLSGAYIPSGVRKMGMCVFRDCDSLEWVVIENGLTTIPQQAFENCYSLSEITIPASVNRIEYFAFDGCYSLKSGYMPNSSDSVSDYYGACESMDTMFFNSDSRVEQFIEGKLYLLTENTNITWLCFSEDTLNKYPCIEKSSSTLSYGGKLYYVYTVEDRENLLVHEYEYGGTLEAHRGTCMHCGYTGEFEAHEFTEELVISEPTAESHGVTYYFCVCGHYEERYTYYVNQDESDDKTDWENGGNIIIELPETEVEETKRTSFSLVFIIAVVVIAAVAGLALLAVAAIVIIIILLVRKKKNRTSPAEAPETTEQNNLQE